MDRLRSRPRVTMPLVSPYDPHWKGETNGEFPTLDLGFMFLILAVQTLAAWLLRRCPAHAGSPPVPAPKALLLAALQTI